MTFFTDSLFLLCASSAAFSCVETPNVTVALSGTRDTVLEAETVISGFTSAEADAFEEEVKDAVLAAIPLQPTNPRLNAIPRAVKIVVLIVLFIIKSSVMIYSVVGKLKVDGNGKTHTVLSIIIVTESLLNVTL
jgi:hypothetical protein